MMLRAKRQRLLQVVGAAVVLVANLDSDILPNDVGIIDAAEMPAEQLNGPAGETLQDALRIRAGRTRGTTACLGIATRLIVARPATP